jgi:predicted aldo/keto reductase-like oxidoreductase
MRDGKHDAVSGRRAFIRASTGALVSSVVFGQGRVSASDETALEAAVGRVGQLPTRPFGGSGRKISALIGATAWPAEVIEAGLHCGCTYWHKAERFHLDADPANGRVRRTPDLLLKRRDAFDCEVIVDRVRGNHETGVIDEEAHYQFVKEAVVKSGLRYFDDMVFHFGYHSVEEYRREHGIVRAFERLKKEGLVRRLGITQHSYLGNVKVPGGQSAPEVLSAVMEGGLYEHAQFFYSYGEDEAVEGFVRAARAKGFGTIAMKTARGIGRMEQEAAFMKTLPPGTSPYHALARWLTTETVLDAAVIRLKSLDEFVETYSGAGRRPSAADREVLRRTAAYANQHACRLCHGCMATCPAGLPIADLMRFERYALDHRDLAKARRLYADTGRPVTRCEDCRQCVAHCPQGLPIPEKLRQLHGLLA